MSVADDPGPAANCDQSRDQEGAGQPAGSRNVLLTCYDTSRRRDSNPEPPIYKRSENVTTASIRCVSCSRNSIGCRLEHLLPGRL